MQKTTLHRVLLVEDSPTVQLLLREMLEEMGFRVVGTAGSVHEAEALVRIHHPQLMVSDIHLPDGDGINLAKRVMSTTPVPIVLITSHDPIDPELAFRALQAGALDLLAKPPDRKHPEFKRYFEQCSRTLKSLAGIPVVRRHHRSTKKLGPPAWTSQSEAPIIAMGASTGGPTLVAELLRALNSIPIEYCVVAQHMVPDFVESFRDWLKPMVERPVRMAEQGERPERNSIYLIPPHRHLELARGGVWNLLSAQSSIHVPSIDILFRSISVEMARRTVAILLTGMGQDGAHGLKALKSAGAYTIVQDPGTALLDSMPRSAIRLDAACCVMPGKEISTWLSRPGWLHEKD